MTGTVDDQFLPEPEPREVRYTVISVDDHLVEPPHMFEGRLPKRLQQHAPRVVEEVDGRQSWEFDGERYSQVGMNAIAGRRLGDKRFEPFRFDLLATFNYATVMLEEAVRHYGILSLEEAVHLLTDVQAQLYGIRERGRVTPGWYADLLVFEPARVGSQEVTMRFDLPGGAGRLYSGANGIDHVLVNGSPTVTNGVLTDSLNGRLLRSGRDTATPSLD